MSVQFSHYTLDATTTATTTVRNFVCSIVRTHLEAEEEDLKKRQKRPTLMRQSQHPRPFLALLSWFFTCPTARIKTKVHPIRNYQKEINFLIRTVLIVVGIVVAIIAFVVEQASTRLLSAKLDFIEDRDLQNVEGFTSFVLFNILFVTIAILPVLYRPVSAGKKHVIVLNLI